jgi:hypothetical protein
MTRTRWLVDALKVVGCVMGMVDEGDGACGGADLGQWRRNG